MGSYDISILACTLCGVPEINWNPTSNFGSAGYICSKCLELQCHERRRAIFLTLYRQIYKALPQVCATYIYDFIHPTNHSQWKILNRHNYTQRRLTMQFFLGGAPCSNNYIHDLHQQLQQQSTCELFWKGKRYRTSSWGIHTDLDVVLCNYLIQSDLQRSNTTQWQHKEDKTSPP